MTEKFLLSECFDYSQTVLEPASGEGAIVTVLSRFFKNVTFYDKEKDFLTENKKYDLIITNPPFSLSLAFLLKAKQIAKKKIAFLFPLSYLHGKERYDKIYNDKEFPLAKVFIFTRYPLLTSEKPRKDGKYKTGMMVYAWYVFDKSHKGDPVIKWIDNNEDILKNAH